MDRSEFLKASPPMFKSGVLDKFTRVQGMNITIVIKNGTDDESRELLTQLGMPFQTEEPAKTKK